MHPIALAKNLSFSPRHGMRVKMKEFATFGAAGEVITPFLGED
jgi:hypothetical protein